MNVKTFPLAEEKAANEFIASHRMLANGVLFHQGNIVVLYSPDKPGLTVAFARAKIIFGFVTPFVSHPYSAAAGVMASFALVSGRSRGVAADEELFDAALVSRPKHTASRLKHGASRIFEGNFFRPGSRIAPSAFAKM